MKFGCNRPCSFRGEVVWNCGRTDGRTTEPAYTISSPGAFGSGELIKLCLSIPTFSIWFCTCFQNSFLRLAILIPRDQSSNPCPLICVYITVTPLPIVIFTFCNIKTNTIWLKYIWVPLYYSRTSIIGTDRDPIYFIWIITASNIRSQLFSLISANFRPASLSSYNLILHLRLVHSMLINQLWITSTHKFKLHVPGLITTGFDAQRKHGPRTWPCLTKTWLWI